MKILFIEPDDNSYTSVCRMLNTIGYSNDNIIRAQSLKEISNIVAADILVILTALALPDSPDIALTFKNVQKAFPYVPVILLIQPEEEQTAITTVKEGSQDYLIKKDIDTRTLRKSIQYAITRKKASNVYKRLFEESPVPMYIYDAATLKFLFINEAALQQYNYTEEEFLSKTAQDIRPQEDWERFREINKNIPNEYYDAGRWLHTRKNGEIFHVHIYAHTTMFEGKKAVVVLAVDIDNKVKAEQELKSKSREIETILNSITDGFYTINKEGILTYVNKEFKKIFKDSDIDPIGMSIWDIFQDSARSKFYTEYKRAIEDNVSVHFEEYYEPLDIWISVNAYPTGDGLAAYFLDITEEKRIREKLYADEQKLRSIINNTKDIIWAVDSEYNIIEANQAFWDRIYQLTGKHPHEYSIDIFSRDLFKVWEGYYKQAMETGPYTMTWTETADGRETYEEVSFSPIYDADNKVVGISCFSRDVTAQRTYQHMIEQQNEQLKNIAWIQSHKVRNHVATILGLTQLIHSDEIQDKNLKTILDGIKSVTDQLDGVIKEINQETRNMYFQ